MTVNVGEEFQTDLAKECQLNFMITVFFQVCTFLEK